MADQDDYIGIQCDGSNWFTLTKGIGNRQLSRVRDEVGAGYGSTNTKIRRIETNVVNTGNAITRAVSSVNGNSYTIRQPGFYAIQAADSSVTDVDLGISRNSSQLTTNIQSITNTDRLAVNNDAGPSTNWYGYLAAGDVLRPHTTGVAAETSTRVNWEIQKMGL